MKNGVNENFPVFYKFSCDFWMKFDRGDRYPKKIYQVMWVSWKSVQVGRT
jgi:hypothetical protein